jgi:hypothetical protein
MTCCRPIALIAALLILGMSATPDAMARANPRATSLAMHSRLFWPRTVPGNSQYCRSRKHPEWTMTVTRNSRCRSVKP